MKKSLAIIIFIILAGLTALLLVRQNQPENNQNTNTENTVGQKYFVVKFEFDNQRQITLQYPYKNGSENLFLITQNISQENNWAFDFDDYGDMGMLITQIDDKINGEGQKYWQYFADLQQPLLSADQFFPEPGQLIEWKFEKSEL